MQGFSRNTDLTRKVTQEPRARNRSAGAADKKESGEEAPLVSGVYETEIL